MQDQQMMISPEEMMNATNVTCSKCGAEFFEQAIVIKKISAMDPHNQSGQPKIHPLMVFTCKECNEPLNLD